MNKIIQLTEHEYNRLHKLATKTSKRIEAEALSLSEKRNKYDISVEIGYDEYSSSKPPFRVSMDIDYDRYGEENNNYREAPKEIRVIANDLDKWIKHVFKKEIERKAKRAIEEIDFRSHDVYAWRFFALISCTVALLSLILNIILLV